MKINNLKYPLLILLSQVFLISASGITARFEYSKISNCAPTIVKFTNNSTRGTGITYIWDFGQGATNSTSDYAAKEQVYSKAGNYKVSLKVTDGVNTDSTSTIITIFSGPAASFTADRLIGCSPLTVNFSTTSTWGDSEITKTSWDFRNGDHRDGSQVQYTYYNTGKYDLILKVTDKNGCSSTLESDNIVTVTDKPKVNFAASDTFACTPPINISFTNLTKGSSDLKWSWDFGNGDVYDGLSRSSVYGSPGTYTVKLKATDPRGCSDSLVRKSYITIGYPKGVLSVYDGNDNKVVSSFLCNGTYRFVYSASTLPDYTWRITESDKITTIKGTNSLTYKVTGSGKINIRVVYGKNGFCTDSVSATYSKSFIKADFKLDDTLFCSLPSVIDLKSSSQNADKIAWYVSGHFITDQNTASYKINRNDMPAETWQQLYDHNINYVRFPFKLVASNGGACFDSVTNEVTVALPKARFMPDKVAGCIPLQVAFSDSSKSVFNIDSYTYKLGSDSVVSLGKAPVKYTFTKPGEYDVTEIIRSNGCIDTSMIVKIVAGDKLAPDITVVPGEVCNGGTIRLTGNAGNNSLADMWRFRSANLFDISSASTHDTLITVYSDTSGYKDINLQVDYNGCLSETTKKSAFKIKGPAGSFSQSFRCDSSLSYSFKSNMLPATSLTWNIDTAEIKNVDSLKYIFPSAGNFIVRLTAADNSTNCTLTRSKVIRVRHVIADFTVNDSIFCSGDTVLLNASVSKDYINNCYNEGFLWTFGDDSPPRRTFLPSFDHIYTSRGTDTISLIVLAENGCTDTTKKVVKVFRPTASFTTDKTFGCLPEMSINFVNTSTDSTIISWVWNFGDNVKDSTNTKNIGHVYKSDERKSFYPTLTVYDAYQCPGAFSVPVHLSDINSNFQADDNAVCTGATVIFTPAETGLSDMLWDYGDGSPAGSIASHTYLSPGEFNVSLTASKEGCTKTVVKSKYISVEKAAAGFTFGDSIYYCYPDTLHFVNNDKSGSQAVDWLWKFGTNYLTNRNSASVEYAFNKPGNYPVQLTVRTLNGCSAESLRHVQINGPNAFVSFSPKDICYNDAVTFTIDSLHDVTQWRLFFGDGTSAIENPVVHNYTSRGNIVPSMQLINNGCNTILFLDTLSVSKVIAAFNSIDSSSYVCLGNKLSLLNNSSWSNSWSWAIDNVPKSNSFNFTDIPFDKTGDYNIRLVARQSGGCTDTLVKKYSVVNNPVFSITGDSVLCSKMNFVTMSASKNTGDVIKWTPSSGLSDPAAFVTQASPASSTTYTATVTSSYGCSASRMKTILVNQPVDLTRFPLSDTSIYLGEKVQLIIRTSADNVSYSWSPNFNISCLNCSNPWVSPTRTVTYSVETKNNCFDFTEKFNIEILADFYLEAPTAFTPNGDSNNDIFLFEEKNIKNFELKIFNRWGGIVFSTNDLHQGWDGTVNGHPQNSDTYKYSVKAETIHGYRFEKKGEFLLLK